MPFFVYTFIMKDYQCTIKTYFRDTGIFRYWIHHETHHTAAAVPV